MSYQNALKWMQAKPFLPGHYFRTSDIGEPVHVEVFEEKPGELHVAPVPFEDSSDVTPIKTAHPGAYWFGPIPDTPGDADLNGGRA